MKSTTIFAFSLIVSASAFVAPTAQTPLFHTSLEAMDRRHFFEVTASAALLVATPALALEDLDELTPAEKEAAEKAAMEARLRRKAELQKQKAAEANSYSSGLKAELAKQKDMKSKSKEQRRNDLCEELGRGC